MRSLNRALPQKLVEERLSSIYGGFVLLKNNYTKISDHATFLCNRQYCPYFNECQNKEWDASVNLVLAGNWNHPNNCMLFCFSKGEFLLQQIFEEFHINYEYQKRFEKLRYKHTLSFDFYLPDYNLCIEFQGSQHSSFESFKNLMYVNGVRLPEEEIKLQYEDALMRDQLKRDFCSKPENPDLFEIPYNVNINSLKKIIKENLNL